MTKSFIEYTDKHGIMHEKEVRSHASIDALNVYLDRLGVMREPHLNVHSLDGRVTAIFFKTSYAEPLKTLGYCCV